MGLKDRARVGKDGEATYGAQIPADGVHIFRIGEGIRLTTPNDETGNYSLMLPMIVDDEGDADNGNRFNHFLEVKGNDPRWARIAEQNLCTLLVQTGLADEVDTAFSSPDNLFDEGIVAEVANMLAVKLTDSFIKLEVRTTTKGDKKNTRVNKSWPSPAVAATIAGGSGKSYG